jgi:hypothetical protein
MGVFSDPSSSHYSSDSWRGGEEDDTLIYGKGSDIIDGRGGYDALVIPFPKADSIIGSYQNGTISFSLRYVWFESSIIPQFESAETMRVSAINIEQLQFSDEVVTLVERQVAQPSPGPAVTPSSQITIPWGKRGFWSRNKKLTDSNDWWAWRGKGARKQYLIDNDVATYSSQDIGASPLVLSGGSWASTQRMETAGGTMLYSGANVIAFFDDWSVSQFDAASKI